MEAMSAHLPDSFHAVVVGGGLGGLAAALRLRAAGARVTLVEKNSHCGGKAVERRAQGFRWDVGPSLLTLPGVVDDLFAACGAHRPDHVIFDRVHPVCRYFWRDGTRIDENEAFFQEPAVRAFLAYASGIWDLSGEAFLTRPPEDLWRAFHPRNWGKLRHLPKVATLATVAGSVQRHFRDPHLRQLFQRFATYNGSNPFRAPATFNVIPYVEAAFGAWYPRGGMARLAEALASLAQHQGVELRTGRQAVHADVTRLELDDGTRLHPDVVVCNGDVIRAHRDWIRYPGHEREATRLQRPPLSLSGMVLLLGVNHRHPALSHHNIFFSDNYAEEFDDLFRRRIPPSDPTIYISATARTSPEDAPGGCDNCFILVNAPAETHTIDWKKEGPAWADRLVSNLEARGLTGLGGQIVHREVFTPADFADRDLSHEGSLYGWASHSPRTALLRPPLESRLTPNLFFVGGTTHPGGGIPLVLLSAKMATEKILRKFGI
jgi:phytoene desaturase